MGDSDGTCHIESWYMIMQGLRTKTVFLQESVKLVCARLCWKHGVDLGCIDVTDVPGISSRCSSPAHKWNRYIPVLLYRSSV